MKMARNGLRVLVFAAVALMVSAGLFAQSMLFAQSKTRAERREEANSRAVQGLVLLPDEKPAVGAVVQLKDMRTLQVRSFITLDDGKYHFSGLRADIDYQLTAKSGELAGGPRTLSIFDNRKDAVMNFKLDKVEKK